MSYCPNCQHEMADGAKFCANCGAPMEAAPPVPAKAFCTNCGAEVPEGSKFCANCGTPAAAPRPHLPVTPPATEPVTFADEDLYTAAAVPEKKKGKGRLVAAIIAIVLVLALGVSWVLGAFDGLFEDDSRASSSSRDDEDEDEDEDKEEEETEEDNEDEEKPDEDEEIPTASESEPESTAPSVNVQDVTLHVWIPDYDLEWLYAMTEEFNATHPEYNLTLEVDFCNEGDTGNAVAADPAAAADLYMYSNDQLGTLVQCGGLTRLGGVYLEQVENDNSYTMINSVTYTDGNVYGFPYSSNTWYMYYDKSVYSETDIQSLESMLDKGVVAFDIANSWYLGSFYAAGGATFFGADGTQADEGIVLHNGGTITHYLVDLVSHPNFVNDVNGSGISGLENGTVNAFFVGSWYAATVRDILGDNMGVAPIPAINVNGETLQPRAFAGSKAIGVNPNCENQKVACIFAAFLSSPEAQLARYEYTGTIPVSLALSGNSTIANDPVAIAQMETVQNTSILQPSIPEMSYYWQPMNELGSMLANGEVNHNNADAIIAEVEAAMNP